MDPNQTESVTIDLTDLSVDGHGDVFTISPNNADAGLYISTVPSGSITWPNASPSYTFSDLSITSPPQAKIQLQGDDADIEINGESVVGMLREIRDRLNILQVSTEMEAEWDELRVLREQYEAKLAECREKSRAWKALKQAG